jgi:hypothetical protein
MKISELPEEIRKVALFRQQECKDSWREKETDNLAEAFDWRETKEGFIYWEELHKAEPNTEEIESKKETKVNKIKKGEKYLCLKDYVMQNGRLAYTKGKSYQSENDLCLTNNQFNKCHQMYLSDEFYEHFEILEEIESTNGTKESEGKLIYELDFEFIKAMAERMAKNKSKYEPFNWKKPIAVDEIKQSFFRHSIEVMQGNYNDEGDEFGHILATSINAMILYYQLKNNKQ